MFLQQGPAETLSYMIAGYVVIFGIMLIYLISLIVRRRNLLQDLEVLEDLARRDAVLQPPAEAPQAEKAESTHRMA